MQKIKWDPVPGFLVWNKVKALRKRRGLTQPQVAVGADISITTLWFIESGFDKKTTIETKKKLANFFECDVSDIFPSEMVGNQTKEEFIESKKRD